MRARHGRSNSARKPYWRRYSASLPAALGIAVAVALGWAGAPPSAAVPAPANPPASASSPDAPDPALRQRLIRAMGEHAGFKDRFAAQVWLLYMSSELAPFMPDPEHRLKLLRAVHREATLAGVSPSLVLAVIQVESRFNRKAVSSAGARGLMQVMPFWLGAIGYPQDNLFHIDTNLRLGCTILKYYMDKAGGDVFDALAMYNGSLGRPDYPERVLRALRRRWAYN